MCVMCVLFPVSMTSSEVRAVHPRTCTMRWCLLTPAGCACVGGSSWWVAGISEAYEEIRDSAASIWAVTQFTMLEKERVRVPLPVRVSSSLCCACRA